MKETDHIPIIKERLIQEKITAILTACAHGDVSQVDSILANAAGDVNFSCKDAAER